MMTKRANERGVALLFALGMLTLLLVTGMAFVANALSAQKVAANNSARTQARMFAQSALNRVIASIMVYQYQALKTLGEFPENFDCVESYGKVKTGSGDAVALDDGLKTDDTHKSIMELPLDDTVVARSIAQKFNLSLGSAWKGSWVYFFNSCDTSDADRKIIGRAAWKVVSHSPQILAPVFLSGHLQTDGTPGWYPSNYRFGREIDEVYTGYADSIFAKVRTEVPSASAKISMQDYAAIYSTLGISEDAAKRWIERWFMPDSESDNSLSDPTEIIPEVYSYNPGSGKNIQLLRFNISEVTDEEYGGVANADPWYLRFGIKNSTSAAVQGNNDAFLNDRFTVDSPKAAMDDDFDYELQDDERPSLPFLRRIGNRTTDNPTFSDITFWRKQIAANFNDYCDADNVPTSDVAADTWMNELVQGTDGKFVQPNYTGNEKTPYLYELGFNMAVHPGTSTTVNSSKTGFDLTEFEKNASGTYEHTPDIWLSMDAIAKLANIYNFNPTGLYDKFTVGVDVGQVEVEFKPTHVSFELTYVVDGVASKITAEKKEVPETMNFSKVKATVDGKSFGTFKLTAANETVTNSGDPKKPYPLLITEDNAMIAHKAKRLSLDGKVSFKLNRSILNDLGYTLPDNAEITRFTISVDAVEVSRVAVNVNRMYLSGNDLRLGKEVGLDYVRAFDSPVVWEADTAAGISTAKILPQNGSNVPGILIGGIRNYDPRQNLNPNDWYKNLTVHAVANCIKFKQGVNSGTLNVLADLHHVMSVASDDAASGQVNQATAGDSGADAANALFRPYPVTGEDMLRDLERAEGPAWEDNDNGADSTKHLSTAFIRNAPMMSPWEIGFIHRGVRWQTINIRTACDPDNNGVAITLKGHAPHDGKWDMPGTSYEKGDGGILDQIKMSEKCLTYGKINVNFLRTNDSLFDATLDQHIASALFTNIHYGQPVLNFFQLSTRTGDYLPVTACGGSPITAFSGFSSLTTARDAHTSRAQFVDWAAGRLETAFGSFTPDNTDAAQEEIIGKIINLICAEKSSPSQIQVVVVAQAIRDVAGMQYRRTADGTSVNKECSFGEFDYQESSSGYEHNTYFDEVVGEVKMLVTIERNISTGRMVIRRVDYLE